MSSKQLPLVYSCSGCSNVAQLANTLALRLDRSEAAEMSCIAGVGGKVPKMVRLARSGRLIVAIDGCKMHCSLACLQNIDVEPDLHLTLSDFGLRKRYGEDCNLEQANNLETEIKQKLEHLQSTTAEEGA
ncbi:putative zinc-binding protein [Methylophaga sp. OBS4]|uniref:putative zinc-binding protein n=1 Tax=Methylophaga sp. OBS4 TaxID=2991935 RepID=UPI0022558996|nr:putative zinc-binding protein [Methylophaga sp. OBS4]MCX4187529.1 zinc-binding protein [Methylophaga sp. OBS4]